MKTDTCEYSEGLSPLRPAKAAAVVPSRRDPNVTFLLSRRAKDGNESSQIGSQIMRRFY